MSRQRITILSFALAMLLLFSIQASAMYTTYQAKIIKPDGVPLESTNVNFRFTILDPLGACILHTENFNTINMAGTGGLVYFSLGSGIKTFPVSASVNFSDVFNNYGAALSCASGGPPSYTPAANDLRKIVMQFQDGSGWQTLPAMSINYVPYAMYAKNAASATTAVNSNQLNGKTDLDFVQVSAIPTCAASQALQFNGASFACVSVNSGGGGGGSITVSGTAPIIVTGTVSSPQISISVASMSSDGYLTAADYAEFKAKLSVSSTQITNTLGFAPVSASAVAAQISAAAAVSSTANALVLRDSSGNIWANDVYANTAKTNYVDIFKPSTAFSIRLQAPTSLSASYNLIFPSDDGLNGQVLTTDGSGNLSWVSQTQTITSSDVVTALGYTPVSSTALGNYLAIANNLSDLSSAAAARTNLGLGGFATINSLDLSTASATGIISDARLMTFSGITSGTQYTKVTVDGKGRVTSGAQLAATDVATALGYTPVSAAAATQWVTSGTTINYMTGNVGIGVSAPAAKLHVAGDASINGLTVGRGGGNDFSNVALGRNALISNTTGWQNVALGEYAMESATNGMQNTAVGSYAMRYDQGSTNNVAVGTYAMESNVFGSYNVAIGVFALDSNTSGNDNVAIGEQALLSNTAGNENIGIGRFAAVFNKTGSSNILLGNHAGYGASNASNYLNSTVIGYYAGSDLRTAGSNNILIGYKAGDQITTGANNIVIGYDIDTPTVATSNSLNIGSLLFATGLNGSGTTLSTGNVGIGTTTPVAKLDVSGGVRIGAESTTCAPALAGTLRYNAINVEYCNGTSWQAFGVAGAGIVNFNGSTSGTQSFATGTGGNAPAFITANGIHTLNIPLASASSVTAGLISNADYASFSNKIASSAVSLIEVLGYVPANTAVMSTSFTSVTASLNSVSSTVASLTAKVSGIKSSQWSDLATASSTVAAPAGFSPLGQLGSQSTTPVGGVDDGYFTFTLPYAVSFNGADYSTIHVGTNSYITFGGGSVNYSSLSAANPAYNKIMIDSADRSSNSVWYFSDATSFSIRFEGGCTTSPSTALVWELQGSITNPSQLKLQIVSVCGGGFSTIASPSATLQSISALASTAYLIDYGAATNGVYLASGNVGIGTNTPVQKFVVSDEGSEGFEVYFNQPDTVVGVQSIDRLTGNFVPMQINASKFSFISGNVGIGTSAPASVLDVSGTLRVSSICDRNGANCQAITSGWAMGSVSASSSSNGYLTSQDWTNFNSKLSVLDLGSVSATGTIAEARFLTQANVVSGTQYTKVTVDGKGRVTSGSFLTSADIVAALSYTPANSATTVSSQWATGGTNISYNAGNVGIGTTAPATALHVVGDIQYTGTITDVSDRRLKTNIEPLDSALTTIRKIKTYSYVMKNDPKARTEYGVMAQDMLGIIPNLVKNIDTQGEYYGVNYIGLIPWSIRALQEVDSETQKLRHENSEIKRELASLKEKNEVLEQKLEKILQALEQQKRHGEKK